MLVFWRMYLWILQKVEKKISILNLAMQGELKSKFQNSLSRMFVFTLLSNHIDDIEKATQF